MKKLLLAGLLLIPVMAFSGCASTLGSLVGEKQMYKEKAYYEKHPNQAKKVYDRCCNDYSYYSGNWGRCNASYYALKDTGNLKQAK